MDFLRKTCPPNIGFLNRLARLLLGVALLAIALVVSNSLFKAIFTLAGAIAVFEALASHCFVHRLFGTADFR